MIPDEKLEQMARAWREPENPDEPICEECGEPYVLDSGCEPGPFCHPCAQTLLKKAFKDIPQLIAEVRELRRTKREPGQLARCPFCLEDDFDNVGLKHHFLAGHCHVWNTTGAPAAYESAAISKGGKA